MSSSGKVLYLGLDPSHYPSPHQITHWPIIQIVPRSFEDPLIQKALENFDCYTHLVFTSKSAVEILKSFLIRFGISLNQWGAKANLAVGRVTAQHLERAGIKGAFVASDEKAEGVIDLIQSLQLKEAHFFWPHSAQSRPLLENYFHHQKMTYTSSIFYDTITQIPDDLPVLSEFDEIIFTSPSTVDAFLEIFQRFPPDVQLTPLGSVTDKHLKKILNN